MTALRSLARRLVILTLFIALTLAGLSTVVVNIRERAVAQRGLRNAAVTADLPFKQPVAGINVDLRQYSDTDLIAQVSAIKTAGFYWVRQTFSWAEIEPKPGEYDWSRYDRLVKSVTGSDNKYYRAKSDLYATSAESSLQFIAVLDESPAWARKPGAEGSRYAPPASPDAFGRFAKALADRYKGAISHFQIWDEPNLAEHWGNLDVRPTEYMAMLRAAYTNLKAVDGANIVIAAGLAPTVETGPRNLNEVDYLRVMYANGAKESMDAVSGKPYGFNTSPLDRTVDAGALNFSRIILLREEMERQGDGAKPIFASHFGWNSLPADWKGAPSVWGQVDTATQISYTEAAYLRANQDWPWMAGMALAYWQPNASQDDPIQGFAMRDRVGELGTAIFSNNMPHDWLDRGLWHPNDPDHVSYMGEWRLGELGADVGQNSDKSDSSFTVGFLGDSVALSLRRDDYVAYLYVTVDDQPANALPRDGNGQAFVLLTSPDRKPHTDLIVLARNLDPTAYHELKVRAYLGYERWAIAGIAVGNELPIDRHPLSFANDHIDRDPLIAGGLLLALLGVIGIGVSARTLPFGRLRVPAGGVLIYLKGMGDVALGIGVTFAAGVSMALSLGGTIPNIFRRDEPTVLITVLTAGIAYFSPSFIVNALAIGALFLLIYNKPSLGLCLTAFFAPFFLYPVQNYVRALPMVELVLVLTVVATVSRAALDWVRQRGNRTETREFTSPPNPLSASSEGESRDLQVLRPVGGVGGFRGWGKVRLLDWVFIAFAILAVLSLLWSEQRAPAIRELRIIVLEPILFYALIRVIPLERKDILRLVDTVIISATVICILGLIGYFAGGAGVIAAEGGVRRLGSVYGSPNNVALFIGRCAPLALAMLLFPLSRLRRVMAGGLLLIMLIALILTQSAGALIFGIPAAFAVVALAWDRRKGAILIGLGVIGLIVVAVLFLPRLQSAFGAGRESSLARVNVWTSAVNLIREAPITGAGLDQFLYVYRSRYILPDAYKEPDLSHPHNVILDFWVRLGIGGLIVIVLMQVGFWRTILGVYRRLRGDMLGLALCAGLMGSMADFLAHGMVDNSFFVVDLAYMACLACGLAVVLLKSADREMLAAEDAMWEEAIRRNPDKLKPMLAEALQSMADGTADELKPDDMLP